MIRRIHVRGFKRFTEHVFDLRPLTILAGMNGAGKTSILHALLLVQEAWRRKDNVVELNGPFGLELGGFEDVLNRQTIESFAITLVSEENVADEWSFRQGETELYATVVQPTEPYGGSFVLRPRMFQYLSAERSGPRITQSSAALPPSVLEVGCRGEYCAQVIDTLGKIVIEKERCCLIDDDNPPLLKVQTEQWLSRLTQPLQIDTEAFPGTAITAIRFRTGQDWVKPTNMGFGITYTLPVILAGLTAGIGGLLLVENPEAHLHPAGQSQVGVFLATMAAAGVQVIAETHSDHVLNGIRRTIGEGRSLPADKAIVHYFAADDTKPHELSFTERGGISSWPAGFFDQYESDVAALTRIRRPR